LAPAWRIATTAESARGFGPAFAGRDVDWPLAMPIVGLAKSLSYIPERNTLPGSGIVPSLA
jgi:hypothetical protein